MESLDLNGSTNQLVGVIRRIDGMGGEVANEVIDKLADKGFLPNFSTPAPKKKAKV
jgi:hypothetical protein